MILSSQGQLQFHIETGSAWQAEDALTWFGSEPPVAEELEEDNDEVLGEYEEWEEDDDEDDEGPTAVALRYRAARSDANVGSIKDAIEEVFGLPEGSVALCGPDGKALRADARIGTLRRCWED